MVASFAGEIIFSVGLAWSCSPRCFIKSTIVCGRGMTDSTCVGAGVVVVVVVVFAFGAVSAQAASNIKAAIDKNSEKVFSRRIVSSRFQAVGIKVSTRV